MKSSVFPDLLFLFLLLPLTLQSYAAYNPMDMATDTTVDFSMKGYATVSGEGYESTTGGSGGDTVHIYTLEELTNWAASREDITTPGIAVIHGKIAATSSTVVTIKHGANVSVLGAGKTSELVNIGLIIWDYSNVIVFNLKIHEVLYPNDAITINECRHVWIDHCELHSKIGEGIGVDTYDGLLDIKNGSRYVTVSWCYFHDHMKTCLFGHTDNAGQLATDSMMRVTLHHNFFQYTDGRNPSLRFGAVHLLNNYFGDIMDYGIAVRQGAHAKLDNNHYHSVKTPITTNKFDGPEGFVCESGTLYSGTCSAADNSITQTDCEFWNTLPYEFISDSTDVVAPLVMKYSGTGKNDYPGGPFIPDTTVNGIPVKRIAEPGNNSITVNNIFPNPMTDKAEMYVYLQKCGTLLVRIFDFHGRIQKEMTCENLNPGENVIILNRHDLLPGLYLISIEFENTIKTMKVSVSN